MNVTVIASTFMPVCKCPRKCEDICKQAYDKCPCNYEDIHLFARMSSHLRATFQTEFVFTNICEVDQTLTLFLMAWYGYFLRRPGFRKYNYAQGYLPLHVGKCFMSPRQGPAGGRGFCQTALAREVLRMGICGSDELQKVVKVRTDFPAREQRIRKVLRLGIQQVGPIVQRKLKTKVGLHHHPPPPTTTNF